jgi:Flp pilus assembly protein TadD
MNSSRKPALTLLSCLALSFAATAAPQATQKKPPTPQQKKNGERPDPLRVLLDQAEQAIEKKDYAAAMPLLRSYLAQRPDDALAHFQLGYAYSHLGRGEEARAEYSTAIKLNPKLAAAHLNLGLELLEHDPAVAIEPFRHAADLLPDQSRPQYLLGLAFERAGNLNAAIEAYQAAERLDDKDYEIHFGLGRALLRAQRAAEAEAEFRAAVGLRVNSAPARLGLGDSLLAQKKPEGAAEELAAYLHLQPEDRENRLQRVSILIDLTQYSEALAELDRADSGAPLTLQSYKLRAQILLKQKQFPQSAEVLQNALALAPRDAELHARLGRIRLELRDFPPAERELRQALLLDPGQTDALRDLVAVYYLSEHYPAALEALDLLAKREEPSAGSWFVRATCYDKLGKKAEALAAYEKFRALDQGRSDTQDFQARQRIRLLTRELQQKKK